MNLFTFIKDIVTYKEPEESERFELLEDEQEDMNPMEILIGGAAAPPQNEQKGKAARRAIKGLMPKTLKKQNEDNQVKQQQQKQGGGHKDMGMVSKSLQKNLERIKQALHVPDNNDAAIREFKIKNKNDAFMVFIDGMADAAVLDNFVLRQLMSEQGGPERSQNYTINEIKENLLTVHQIKVQREFSMAIDAVMNGLAALFVDGCEECILIESRGFEKRSVTEPSNEMVIRGPSEAFVENLRTNLTLVRRIIRNKDLVTEMLPMGKVDNNTCGIMYIKGIVNPKIVEEVKRRIKSVDIDFIPGDGPLDAFIEEHPFSLFPQTLSTERPDRTALHLMEGRVAIMCEGSPFATIVPINFFDLFHTSEDVALSWQYATFLRIIRLIGTGFSLFLPALFVSLTMYHQEMVPTELLLSLAKSRENIPFPSVVELILMEISFELIREAGLRVPGVIGQTLGIIGAVILGQAAVAAGIVSPVLIIVVALTGMGSFAIPNFSVGFGIRIARFFFIGLAAIAGLYGVTAGVFVLCGYLCSMKSFGVPYMSPVAPKSKTCCDVVVRIPTWAQKRRPDFLNTKNRQKTSGVVRGWLKKGAK